MPFSRSDHPRGKRLELSFAVHQGSGKTYRFPDFGVRSRDQSFPGKLSPGMRSGNFRERPRMLYQYIVSDYCLCVHFSVKVSRESSISSGFPGSFPGIRGPGERRRRKTSFFPLDLPSLLLFPLFFLSELSFFSFFFSFGQFFLVSLLF